MPYQHVRFERSVISLSSLVVSAFQFEIGNQREWVIIAIILHIRAAQHNLPHLREWREQALWNCIHRRSFLLFLERRFCSSRTSFSSSQRSWSIIIVANIPGSLLSEEHQCERFCSRFERWRLLHELPRDGGTATDIAGDSRGDGDGHVWWGVREDERACSDGEWAQGSKRNGWRWSVCDQEDDGRIVSD